MSNEYDISWATGIIPSEKQIPPGSVDPKPTPTENGTTPADEQQDVAPASTVQFGKVLNTSDTAADPTYGFNQTILAGRATEIWDGTTNAPVFADSPSISGGLSMSMAQAFPFPPRHDQRRYITASGDGVMMFSGPDGMTHYLSDDLPFPAVVIAKATASEANAGGVGTNLLTARRLVIAGTPPAAGVEQPYDGSGELLTGSTPVSVEGIEIIAPAGQHHGYRVGDIVWVQRRGLYYFALPAPQSFLAKIVAAGPAAAADFTDNRYWVQEQLATVTYATNAWSWSLAARSATDPTATGGTRGRLVCAKNLSETTTHVLAVDGSAIVAVTMIADPASGAPAYVFTAGGGGLPASGSEGYILRIVSGDPAWSAESTELPGGGSDGQVLKRVSGAPAWAADNDTQELPNGVAWSMLWWDVTPVPVLATATGNGYWTFKDFGGATPHVECTNDTAYSIMGFLNGEVNVWKPDAVPSLTHMIPIWAASVGQAAPVLTIADPKHSVFSQDWHSQVQETWGTAFGIAFVENTGGGTPELSVHIDPTVAAIATFHMVQGGSYAWNWKDVAAANADAGKAICVNANSTDFEYVAVAKPGDIPDITGKADKIVPAADVNIAVLDGTTGQLEDGGQTITQVLASAAAANVTDLRVNGGFVELLIGGNWTATSQAAVEFTFG